MDELVRYKSQSSRIILDGEKPAVNDFYDKEKLVKVAECLFRPPNDWTTDTLDFADEELSRHARQGFVALTPNPKELLCAVQTSDDIERTFLHTTRLQGSKSALETIIADHDDNDGDESSNFTDEDHSNSETNDDVCNNPYFSDLVDLVRENNTFAADTLANVPLPAPLPQPHATFSPPSPPSSPETLSFFTPPPLLNPTRPLAIPRGARKYPLTPSTPINDTIDLTNETASAATKRKTTRYTEDIQRAAFCKRICIDYFK